TTGGAATVNKNLALQAGRHIILASSPNATPESSAGAVTITMNGGAFSATTNADGADPNNRDPGLAQFVMADGSAITGATNGVTLATGIILGGDSVDPGDTLVNDNVGSFTVGSVST